MRRDGTIFWRISEDQEEQQQQQQQQLAQAVAEM